MRTESKFEGIEQVKRPTTAGIIAERIRTAIIDGPIEPGSQLGEAQLAKVLGVSRGPVREAMQRLIQEGLLRSEPNRGVFVVKLGRVDIADIYFARTIVERAAVTRLLDAKDSDAIEALGGCYNKMEKAARRRNPRAVAEWDLEFHKTLVRASKSKRLDRMFQTLLTETRMCISASGGELQLDLGVLDEHAALLEALRSGDRKRAIVTVEKHMKEGVRRRFEATPK